MHTACTATTFLVFKLVVSQQHTQVIPNAPGLVIVKMDISLPVGFGEERMRQDPPRAIKGQAVSMPVPRGGGSTRLFTQWLLLLLLRLLLCDVPLVPEVGFNSVQNMRK